MNLKVTSSPHIQSNRSTKQIMYTVILALFPVMINNALFFKFDAVKLLTACVAGSIVTEFLIQKARRKPATISDGSAIITGILLSLVLPARTPVLIAFLGSSFAIAAGKQLFGGLGLNLFNPALLGKAFLMAFFPAIINVPISPEIPSIFNINIPGLFETSFTVSIILGSLILIITDTIDWRIPAGYIGTVLILNSVLSTSQPLKSLNIHYIMFSDGLLLGAVFMATDHVTSPFTKKGRWIFAIGCGIILIIIRLKDIHPQGVVCSILLMNALTPLINRITIPKIFGFSRK